MTPLLAPFLLSPQVPTGKKILAELRTPVPFSPRDAQIKAARLRTVVNAQRDPKTAFETALARARRSRTATDFVLLVAAGFETIPPYVDTNSKDFTKVAEIVRKLDPGKSLECRRAAYLMQAEFCLVVVDEDIRTDPNGRIRRALLDAYPSDTEVWMRAAQEVMYVSRSVGTEDARRIAAWWNHPPVEAGKIPQRYAPYASMHAWLAIAYATKSKGDAAKAEGYYRAWSKLATPAQAHQIEMFGRATRAAKQLAKNV